MKKVLGDDALNEIFREARTHNAWLDKPVSDEILGQLYDLMKWGPTSANGSPGRLVFLRTPAVRLTDLILSLAPIISVTSCWSIEFHLCSVPVDG